MKKVYFESEAAAIEANRKEAKRRKCDMKKTSMWWGIGEDESGWYLMVEDSPEQ